MSKPAPDALEMTYPLRATARLTGLSPETLRAWERRHGVVVPLRTPGGTRRYRAADVTRLKRVKAAVDAGHRIGEVARLTDEELERRAAVAEAPAGDRLTAILAALERLDAAEALRLLAAQLSALGPVTFSRDVALPLVREIGERWVNGRMGKAQEHLASGVLRSLLGGALQPTAQSLIGPRIVFATPSGERHELGLLMAALTAAGAGANVLYLGTDLPAEDLAAAADESEASVLALGLVAMPAEEATRWVAGLHAILPSEVRLWLGGAGAREVECPEGALVITSLEEVEQQVMLLAATNEG